MATDLDRVIEMLRAAPFTASVPVADARAGMDGLATAFPVPAGVTVEKVTLGGRPAEKLTAGPGPVVLYLHGGGYVIGSPTSHRHLAARLALDLKGSVYTADYRMAPEDPFPAAVDDALAAYRDMIGKHGASNCAVAGDSAGGGLSFVTLIGARDAGLAMPACMVGLSPWVNLGTENPSYDRLAEVDPLLSRDVVAYFAPRYAGKNDVRNPRVSPLFANLAGLPPTLIQIGDREIFLGDAVAMHESLIAAGVDTKLVVWKTMFHVWQLYWPMLEEGRAAIAEIADFVRAHCRPA